MLNYRVMMNDEDWKLKLMQSKSGMPKRFAYISEIREMHPDLTKDQVKHLHAVWNFRSIKDKKNEVDQYWGVKLLIDLCTHLKQNWQ